MNNNQKKFRLGYILGTLFVVATMGSILAIIIGLTLKFLMWLF